MHQISIIGTYMVFSKSFFLETSEKLFKRKFVILLTQKFASVTVLETSFTKFGCNGNCQISTKWEIFDILIKFQNTAKYLGKQINC
jgi:hypothetical protein